MITYDVKTDVGRVRRNNEDSYRLPPAERSLSTPPAGELCVVCDGMGGAAAGEIASDRAARWLVDAYYANPETPLRELVRSVNRRLYDLARKNPEYRGMGTTMVSVLVDTDTVTICCVGDSRVYRLRGNVLEQLTEDQSEVWELYRSGALTKDELRFHPRNNIITHVLGVDKELAASDIQVIEHGIDRGDRFLLCTDGLTDMLSDGEIRAILLRSPESPASALVEAANAAGGRDNVTVVVATAQ